MPHVNSMGSSANSLRINSRSSGLRTSSNTSFAERFNSGMKTAGSAVSNALSHITRPIPGAAALTAGLSNAARSLSGSSSLGGSASTRPLDGDINNVQDDLVENNKALLERQFYVSQITAMYTAQSQVIRAMYESLKGIAANIR